MTRALLATLLLLVTGVAHADADPALLARVESVATGYHLDSKQLDVLRGDLTRLASGEARPDALIALARISFIWGDVRATSAEQKLDAYDRGREAARRAVTLEPKNALAHLWYAINMARWGQTKGIVRSLFLLTEVQREIDTIIELDPKLTAVYALAGNVYYEVPGMLGGDLDKAEAMFRRGLEQDRHFTAMRIGLAKTLIRRGRIVDARRELEAVLAEGAPRNRAEHTMKDTPEARRLLESIKERS